MKPKVGDRVVVGRCNSVFLSLDYVPGTITKIVEYTDGRETGYQITYDDPHEFNFEMYSTLRAFYTINNFKVMENESDLPRIQSEMYHEHAQSD